MRFPNRPLFYLVTIIAAAFAGFLRLSAATPKPIQYVVLEGGGPDQGPGPDVGANMLAIAEQFGAMPAASDRMVAYGVQQLRILSRSAAVVRRDVEEALDLAERTGIPVFLHIDACYGWGADSEKQRREAPPIKFWEHPEMREWYAFPKDERLPDRIPRSWLCWGPWCSPAAAVPAYGSPKFMQLATSQLDQGVLIPLANRLAQWNRSNREHLFAGINIGWEVHIPDFGDPAMRHLITKNKGPVRADVPRNARGLQMDPGLVGKPLGYASLHWRGWDERRLAAAAKRERITRDEKFRQLGYQVLYDYMEALAKTCHKRGLSPDRVYTHIVALATVSEPNTFRPPVWTAVNPYSTPGFTMDNRGGARFNLAKLKQDIRDANGNHGSRFAVVETYFTLAGKAYFEDEDAILSELETLFSAGASLQAYYGGFPLTKRTPTIALTALQQWLDGASNNKEESNR